jgi:hypothetical protein
MAIQIWEVEVWQTDRGKNEPDMKFETYNVIANNIEAAEKKTLEHVNVAWPDAKFYVKEASFVLQVDIE